MRNTWNKYSKLRLFQFKWNRNHSIPNKSPKFIQIYHHYSSYSTIWSGIDGIDGILFQFYLFPKKFAFHLLFRYSTRPLPIPKNYQKECSLSFVHYDGYVIQLQFAFRRSLRNGVPCMEKFCMASFFGEESP